MMNARRPSVHRRVVSMSRVVSSASVLAALCGISLFNAQQYRANAREDAGSVGGIVAV
jgi:hypothetical protein